MPVLSYVHQLFNAEQCQASVVENEAERLSPLV